MRLLIKHGFAGGRMAVIACVALLAANHAALADDWLPIDQEELKMTSEPKAPGAAAILLYRQVDRDDSASYENIYNRIKILTDAGREFGNLQLEYEKSYETISSIEARTIEPDGRIVNFSGTIYDKPVVEARQGKIMQKSLSLPDVKVGSIIEYRYRHRLRNGWIFDSHWILSDELYTKFAKFSLVAYDRYVLRYSWPAGLPPGTNPPSQKYGKVHLETRDVPAFVTEDHMPPPNELKMRVDFMYVVSESMEMNPDKYWKTYGKREFKDIEHFVDEKRAMARAVAEIVAPGDSSDVQLRKIYARVLGLRNTTFERKKTEQEADRANEKDAHDVEDVWKHGYGNATQLTWLLLGLVRAAGFQADAVLVSTRDKYLFNRKLMDETKLNSNLIQVLADGKTIFLDPGVPTTPFGVLPWWETAVYGLKLDNNGGSWVSTPIPEANASQVQRTADLKLTRSGALEGKLTVTYTGLEALRRRTDERDEDDTERKEFLENEIKAWVPSGIEINLLTQPNWSSADPAMTATFDLKVPGWAAVAGQRALLPASLFSASERKTFQHGTRVHPIYFNFPHRTLDALSIELPTGWLAGNLPPPREDASPAASYRMSYETKGQSLRITRDYNIGFVILDSKYYGSIQHFFDEIRTGDEEQLVITSSKATAQN